MTYDGHKEQRPIPSRRRIRFNRFLTLNWKIILVLLVLAVVCISPFFFEPESFYWVEP